MNTMLQYLLSAAAIAFPFTLKLLCGRESAVGPRVGPRDPRAPESFMEALHAGAQVGHRHESSAS